MGTAVQAAEPPVPRFQVTGFEITGENPLSEKAALAAVEPFLGEHEGLAALQSAADALERKLRQSGYSFHRVVLPPQTLQDGEVRLQVVRFPVADITVENNRHFTRDNILNSLPQLQSGQSPNVRRLSRSMRFANNHPAKQLQLSFRESGQAQAVNARVQVDDRRPWSVFTVLQNSGTEQTGEYRMSLGYQYSNLFDRDHTLSLIYTGSPDESGAVGQSGLTYRIPFYSHAGALSFAYTDSNVDSVIIGGSDSLPGSGANQNVFSITGEGTVASLRYEYSFLDIGRYRHQVFTGYADKLFDNVLTFNDGQTGDGQVIDEASGKVRTNPFSVGYSGRYAGLSNVFGFRLEAIANQPSGSYSDEAAYTGDAEPDWSAFRYSLNYDWRFAGDWLLRLRYLGQQAGETLVDGEKFGLGGAHSVRGYDERSILGDNGWQSNLEAWTPSFAGGMNALMFYDTGAAETDISGFEIEAAGAGLGLRWSWAQNLAVRLDVARALEPVNEVEEGDTTVHFSAFYRF